MSRTPLLITILYVCSITISCQKKQQTETTNFKAFRIETGGVEKHFFEQIENLSLIILPETDSTLISGIGQAKISNGFLYIVDWQAKTLIKLTEEGEIKNVLHKPGKGPYEYRMIDDFEVTESEIITLDANRRQLQYWTKNLKFKKSQRIPFQASGFDITSDGFIFDNNYTAINDSLKYNIVFTNKALKITRTELPFDNQRSLLIATNSIQKLGNTFTYRPAFVDTIYQLDDTNSKAIYKLDFGEKWKFNDGYKTDQEFMQVYGNPNAEEMVLWVEASIDKKKIFIRSTNSDMVSNGTLIDLSTGKQIALDLSVKEQSPQYAVRILGNNYEGKSLMQLDPFQFEELLTHIPESEIIVLGDQSISDARNTENPKLLLFSFKPVD
ncbi:6-bladed beta-propeller [Roseivirga pacifica]|uniref:6-bladed beta-propeller n=1 Tax=Roseivirga pacifica TaxID=1267423 RepID=UPI00227A02CE|nr:6-bladed beta-propeller [Roseivirga pacifica]